MEANHIIERIETEFSGIVPKTSWGETSLFYNPDFLLPNGVYFCTVKEKNGDNDQASDLDREGIFRISFGISNESFVRLFGAKPKRPSKGGIVDTNHNFGKLDELMPHPIYGWMSWVQILNPSYSTFESIFPLIEEAHSRAVIKFKKKTEKFLNERY